MTKIFFEFTVIISLIWAGMILGISFLEAWIKFHAPTLTKAVGLDVGRTVFRGFHNVQLVLALLLVITVILANPLHHIWLLTLVALIILAVQMIVLFPRLNKRTTAIIAGQLLPVSYTHTCYGILEIIKLIDLFFIGWLILNG